MTTLNLSPTYSKKKTSMVVSQDVAGMDMIIDEEEIQKEKDSTSMITEEGVDASGSKIQHQSLTQLSKSKHQDSSKRENKNQRSVSQGH